MNDPDDALVRQAKTGDKSAFGKLVDRYYEMVYAVAFGVLHHREAAKDAAQEVFLKAYRELIRFEGKSKFKTWLYRVAVNTALDEVRKRKPVQSLDATDKASEEDVPPVIIPDRAPGPRDRAAQRELRQLLDEAIEQLSPDHRAVLVLREWQELSYEEIAETLGIEMGTVMSRIHYARKRLGEILEGKVELG
ncbi:MAG TPA: sigma-70 family RNA polymerase sigma factor [bacterium]|nr:sigma-70 family RNA polymerase sigma factor [bacterium]